MDVKLVDRSTSYKIDVVATHHLTITAQSSQKQTTPQAHFAFNQLNCDNRTRPIKYNTESSSPCLLSPSVHEPSRRISGVQRRDFPIQAPSAHQISMMGRLDLRFHLTCFTHLAKLNVITATRFAVSE